MNFWALYFLLAIPKLWAYGSYSVTYYDPGSMPVECETPPGFSRDQGIAIIEGDPLVEGAVCEGWSSGLPDCSKVLREKELCGTIIRVSYRGQSRLGWLSGICPWHHPVNSAKGEWNPCGQGRSHLDLMSRFYYGLGLESHHSWGPYYHGGEGWRVNPRAAYLEAWIETKIPGVGTIWK